MLSTPIKKPSVKPQKNSERGKRKEARGDMFSSSSCITCCGCDASRRGKHAFLYGLPRNDGDPLDAKKEGKNIGAYFERKLGGGLDLIQSSSEFRTRGDHRYWFRCDQDYLCQRLLRIRTTAATTMKPGKSLPVKNQ